MGDVVNDRVAIVTGSTRGIGLEIAKTLGKAGYSVMLSGRNEESLAKVKAELETMGIVVSTCRADVSNAKDAEKLVADTLERFGRIDTLVNNAGVTCDNLLMRMDENAWDSVLQLNMQNSWLMSLIKNLATVLPLLFQAKIQFQNVRNICSSWKMMMQN